MQPGSVFGKLLQEHCRSYSSSPTSAGIDDIRDVGANALLVLFIQWQAPHLLARFVQSLLKAVKHLVVVGENASIDVTKRDHASAS